MLTAEDTILITGGAGFIGSAVVRHIIGSRPCRIVTLDALTYAGNAASLADALHHPRHTLVRGDICEEKRVRRLLDEHQPVGILHLAAESHVDRSIDAPASFVHTNVVGTGTLLQEARRYHEQCARDGRPFRFLHVSTDEVFGSLELHDPPFTAATPYAPRSPYSASKAASDHLARAWWHTFGLPVVVTNCSNNYGPYQFPEKLIPHMILSAIAGRPLPVYGAGANIRDWLYVDDHARGLLAAFEHGTPGETYLFGGNAERTNLQVVQQLCDLLDQRLGRASAASTRSLITHVADRPGHDHRYAIDASYARTTLGWAPQMTFDQGLASTVDWYLTHADWCEAVTSGSYQLGRIGLGANVGANT